MNYDKKIEFEKISMKFGDFFANKDISFQVDKGKVHAILGENGAGKSTLMSILFGLYHPTSGNIKVNGEVKKIRNPKVASELGIAMLPQHFKLVDNMSGWENIILGSEKTYAGIGIKKKLSMTILKDAMQKYNINVDLKKKISKLSVSEKQKIELLKMLWKDNDILIFDEPTSILTPQEIKEFLSMVKDLKKAEKTIIIITHKLDEIKEIADSCTILRKGEVVSTVEVSKTSKEKLVELMVGKAVDLNLGTIEKNKHREREVVLSIRDLNVKTNSKSTTLKNINLEVHQGEIVGIAAIDGNGQSQLFEAISGLHKYSGDISIDGHNLNGKSVKERYFINGQNFISHIPEDRHENGLFLNASPAMNAVMQVIDSYKVNKWIGLLNFRKINSNFEKLEKEYDVRGVISRRTIARDLSGGNQQKLIIARELSRDSKLTLAVHPTRGLDMGAIRNVYTKLIEKRNAGGGVLFFSGEMDEILQVSDRIVVIAEGQIVGEFDAKQASRNKIGELMTGGARHE